MSNKAKIRFRCHKVQDGDEIELTDDVRVITGTIKQHPIFYPRDASTDWYVSYVEVVPTDQGGDHK